MKNGFIIASLALLLASSPALAQDWAIASGNAEEDLRAQEAALLEEMRKSQGNNTEPESARARADIEKALAAEKKELQRLQGEVGHVEESVNRMRDSDYDAQVVDESNSALKKAASKSNSYTSLAQESSHALVSDLKDEIEMMSSKLEKQNANVSRLKQSNTSLQGKLAVNRDKLSALRKELEETRNQLIVAEAEVSRLSRLLDERNKTSLSKYTGSVSSAAPRKAAMKVNKKSESRQLEPAVYSGKASSDMAIATVVASKANLRTGPGLNNSPLMSVGKGTRLAVETRKGDWYRVIAPTGIRAWVSGTVVAFGKTKHSSPTKTVSIKGYDSSIEQQAFQLIKKAR